MRATFKTRWLLAMGIAAVSAGTVLGFWFGAPIAGGVAVVSETIARSVGWATTARPEVLSLPGQEMTKDAPSTTQSLTGFDELSYAVYELVGGRRTNFQNVKTFPEDSLIRQLANGVGSLRVKFKGQDDSHACTAFVVSDKPGGTYALTAGHCFYQDGVCPAARNASSTKTPPAIADMYLVFNQFENRQLPLSTTNPNAIPATLVKGELKCGNVDSTDKDKPYVDYAIVKLDDKKFQDHRSLSTESRIAPVSLGVVEIKGKHQLLILSQPDGRALMATERNCLATENPSQPNGSFAHYCDTLKGSSGAPVFSRDHAVVAGLHTRSQYNPFAAGEENIAIPIETIVTASPLLQSLDILIRDPLTAEQQKLVDYANQRGEESSRYVDTNQDALAAYVALDGLERILEAKRNEGETACLIERSSVALGGLAKALNLNRELARFSSPNSNEVRARTLWEVDTRSPDRKHIVTVSGRYARLWDWDTGAPSGMPMKHDAYVSYLAFSPDGTRLVTATDSRAQLWALPSGKPMGASMKPRNEAVNHVLFSHDGKRLLIRAERSARLWDGSTGAPLGAPMETKEAIRLAAFSTDDTRVLTLSSDNTARLWDGRTGTAIGVPISPRERLGSVQFSPDAHSTRVLTIAETVVQLWDGYTGAPLGAPMRLEAGFIDSAMFNRDGTRVLTNSGWSARLWDGQTGAPMGAPIEFEGRRMWAKFDREGKRIIAYSDRRARMWNAQTGVPLPAAMEFDAKVSEVPSAAFSPDDQRLVTISRDQARLWDAKTGAAIGVAMNHGGIISRIAFTDDGELIATVGDRTVRIWDGHSGVALGAPMKHDERVVRVEFNDDGTRVVATTENGTLLWDTRADPVSGFPMKHAGPVRTAKYSPDGERLVTISENNARLWDAHTGRSLKPIGRAGVSIPVFRSYGEPLPIWRTADFSVAFSSDSKLLLTTSDAERTVKLWDGHTGARLRVLKPERLARALFSPDGTRVLTTSSSSRENYRYSEGTAQLWNSQTGAQLGREMSHESDASPAFSPDGKRIVTIELSRTALLWDGWTGLRMGNHMPHDGKRILSVTFSSDGKRVLTSSADTAHLWDGYTGAPIGRPMGHRTILSADFSHDGKRVLTVSLGVARLWNGSTGAPVGMPMQFEMGEEARFSPDDTRILTISYDYVRLWDGRTGAPLGAVMKHDGHVMDARFSRDGDRVVTASADGTAQIWDAYTGAPLGASLKHGGTVCCASFNPDSTRVVTASEDGTAHVWEVLPRGLCLIDAAYQRLRFRQPSPKQCSLFDLDCRRQRVRNPTCDLKQVATGQHRIHAPCSSIP